MNAPLSPKKINATKTKVEYYHFKLLAGCKPTTEVLFAVVPSASMEFLFFQSTKMDRCHGAPKKSAKLDSKNGFHFILVDGFNPKNNLVKLDHLPQVRVKNRILCISYVLRRLYCRMYSTLWKQKLVFLKKLLLSRLYTIIRSHIYIYIWIHIYIYRD